MTTFYEQVSSVAARFESWGACERTVALVALLRRVPWPGLRLCARFAEKALDQADAAERRSAEEAANDARWLSAAAALPPSERLRRLLDHLPLLRPGNRAAKALYLHSVPALLAHAAAQPDDADRCQELLSYLLIHPALDDADRADLRRWLAPLSDAKCWPSAANPAFRRTVGKNVDFRSAERDEPRNTDAFSDNGKDVDLDTADIPISKPRRSNSLTPPSASYGSTSSSSENLAAQKHKPRSFSLSSERGPLIGGELSSSSGSETRLDDRSGGREGMSTVAHWLKTLRLHKYQWLFSDISYDRMMAIDEEYLQQLGVTKGARHKLLLSIKKLSEREAMLHDAERELAEPGHASASTIASALERLRGVVVGPIKPDSTLAGLVVRVLDLASARILQEGTTYRDGGAAASLHCWLVDRALAHDAFSRNPKLTAELKSLKYRVPPRQFLAHLGDVPFQRRQKPRWRNCAGSDDGNRKSSSYPSFPPRLPPPRRLQPTASTGDINSRLESLCLQMTERAID